MTTHRRDLLPCPEPSCPATVCDSSNCSCREHDHPWLAEQREERQREAAVESAFEGPGL